LNPGTHLGPYEILAPLGAGGMGEVYRARDRKLNRDVAIKVLLPSVAGDPDRLARFSREAQVLASLNHPNIAHIHGLEESGGVTALILELVEGEDLAQQLARGPIALDEALPIARQIAEALEAAHDHGIIHRDLKPANIKVRADGTVKVLDFGLAKAVDPAAASNPDAMNSPTLSMHATQAGVILGTAAYMSPEQARGRPVDKRADIWAFGAVVFEMLTGRRAFPGEDITDTIVSVVSKEPDWDALPEVPAALRRLLARCMTKDPKARLRDIGEARVLIDELRSGAPDPIVSTAQTSTAPLPRAGSGRALTSALAIAAFTLAIAVVWLWAPWNSGPSARTAALQFTPLSFEQGGQTAAVWSPDGKAVTFGARQKTTDPFQVYVRYLDSPVATRITHMAVSSTPTDWTAAGRIVFYSAQAPAGLWSVSPVGGEPEPLQAFETPVASVSRDGTAMAGLRRGEDGVYSIWISSPPGAALTPYLPAPFASRRITNGPQVRFSPDGRQILMFRNAGAGEEAWLMPYPADQATPPSRIFLDLPAFSGTPEFSWMPDNRHVVLSFSPGGVPEQLYMADTVSGEFALFSSGTSAQRWPAVSPDGGKLVFLESAADFDIGSVDLSSAAVTPAIATQRSEEMPAWSAKGAAMVYVTDRSGAPEIWLHTPGQTDRPLVTASSFPTGTTQWFMAPMLSPDATRVVYVRLERGGAGRLWMSAVSGGPPVPLVKNAEIGYGGSWSPDGNWLVYWLLEDGRYSLKKVKTTGQAAPELLKADITRVGTWLPIWSPSGDWILHGDGGVKLISADGKATRDVSSKRALAFAFSADGTSIYGLRAAVDGRSVELFSINATGGAEKMLGSLRVEHLPANSLNPSMRLTLTPDGKSLTYSTVKRTSNLWLTEGLAAVSLRK